MAGDEALDSNLKHRRSSSDDETAEKSSKRHKHRHNHRHHHRHHRHSSRKREEESKLAAEDSEAPKLPVPAAGNSRPDDDVEEGEILDEDGGGGDDMVAKKKTSSSDVESGEIDAIGVGDQFDKRNLGLGVDNGSARREANISGKGNLKKLGDYRSDDDLLPKLSDEDHYRETTGSSGVRANGVLSYQSEEKRHQGESGSPSKGSGKQNRYYDEEKVEVEKSRLGNRWKSSSESTGDKSKPLVHSPSHGRYHDEPDDGSMSRSYDHMRERSSSRSVMEEEALSKRRRYHEEGATFYDSKRKIECDMDDGRTVRHHDILDVARDEGREHGTSYSTRYNVEGRHHSRDRRDRERSREREVDRNQRREKETRSRGREMDRDRRKDKDSERSRDRDLDRDRRREKTIDWSRDVEMDRARKREKERDRSRDRVNTVDRDRDIEREREKERDRYSDRVMDRKRERRDDGYRDKGRDREKDRYENSEDIQGGRDRYKHSRNWRHEERDNDQHRTRNSERATAQKSKGDALELGEDKLKRDDEEQEDYEERSILQLHDQEEDDLNRIKEESRRRRQAILEKYKNQHLQQQVEVKGLSEDAEKEKRPADNPGQSTAALHYSPDNIDGRGDEIDKPVAEPSFSVGKSPPSNGVSASGQTFGARGLGDGTPKSERSGDMFCDDIFGETPTGVRKAGKGDGLRIERSGLHDNWDDAEGYYSYRFGELLDGRYEIISSHGKGVFSTVVRAKNVKSGSGEPEEVAIKIIRNNDTMYKAGLTELVILKKLVGQDPENKRHCVRFLSSFKYRNHLCLVFESLHMNLREVLKKFGRNIGLKLTAVRAYAKQLFIALKHLKNCGVLHCDIKPDNMLVNEAKNVLKLCDFGNAMFAGKNEITPYLVSRFYRAPEIILGLPYDHPLDIWSVGCCLYELYTGKVLFPGATNNDMLRLHMELKGPFPKKMLRKGAFTDQNFDQDLNFHATEEDPVTKKTIKRLILNIKPKDIGSIITGSSGEDPKMIADFKDLLDKMFVLDPDKRLTVSQALSHPFITGK
ncbi:hypothetical protein FEM48_Zijuj10G0147000 [Ziziphus jujuba var. spinosa]|uniref:Serine/threonine-protein kinase PRP4 homolog n=1 Tax=Ziziphus jujuba var. spinosa TaxID=714518 RepID=A0A978UNZ9_ZIZJJ|nr:hypothetical protein FEM48_Zijuj10G0147000 [Ziziphus jujuba var. spinosa]